LGWNGTDTIDISGLWPQQGSFSHGDIYGTPQAAIPEPATMLLLGIGLIGLAGFRKKFISEALCGKPQDILNSREGDCIPPYPSCTAFIPAINSGVFCGSFIKQSIYRQKAEPLLFAFFIHCRYVDIFYILNILSMLLNYLYYYLIAPRKSLFKCRNNLQILSFKI
jgi:hypothetical protein